MSSVSPNLLTCLCFAECRFCELSFSVKELSHLYIFIAFISWIIGYHMMAMCVIKNIIEEFHSIFANYFSVLYYEWPFLAEILPLRPCSWPCACLFGELKGQGPEAMSIFDQTKKKKKRMIKGTSSSLIPYWQNFSKPIWERLSALCKCQVHAWCFWTNEE